MNNFTIDRDALLKRFLEYVQIDSETEHEGNFARFMVGELEKIGLQVEVDSAHEKLPTDGFNIYATLPGDSDLEPLLFCAHLDTVCPGKGIKPTVCDDGYVRSDGTTILGGDDKAGLCAILEAVIQAKSLARRPTVEVVLTVQEEGGLLGANVLDYSKITAKKGIVLDSSGGPEKITTSAPSENKIFATIHGKRAHAGIAPETGISAIQVAAVGVSKMNLLRVDQETTCNIGTFHSQSPTNIVSPQAELVLEVRSRNHQKLVSHTQHLVSCLEDACKEYGATLEYKIQTGYVGFSFDDENPWVKQVKEGISSLGLTPITLGSGGGSDANVLNQNGITTLNLGIGMEKVHTTEEQQNILQMNQGSEICYQLISHASKY